MMNDKPVSSVCTTPAPGQGSGTRSAGLFFVT
ncbi:hypothetical protein BN439_0956 [Erwinia amylovora Ea644]|nr:hypothetical protein BN439_0956 [Erwinia amylovora Ea644]